MAGLSCSSGGNPDYSDVPSGRYIAPTITTLDADLRQRADAVERIAALGEMTGGIVHDFRNVLAIIESGLNMAGALSDNRAMLQSSLEAAHEGVQRGLKITSRLLNFTKPQEVEPSQVNLNDLLRGLESFIRYSVGSCIKVHFVLSPDIPDCLVDSSQFNAAILNLVVNARDAMPEGGVIRISTELLGNEPSADPKAEGHPVVRVRVKDNGRGMSPEVQRRVFDPYFTTKCDKGTGLGVPQVCAFMKRVGGKVAVESVVGAGTEFDLLFPVYSAASLIEPRPEIAKNRSLDK